MANKLQTTRWAFDLSSWSPTLTELTQAVAVIQPEERSRLIKFYFINDFLSSLVGRLLIRKYISQYCGLSFEDIKLARDSRGKPYWVQDEMPRSINTPNISFNVSHQGKFVVLAGAVNNTNFNDFGIGCDIMKLEYSGGRDLQNFFRVMHTKFGESEWRFIKQPHFNQQQQIKAFMRHWCLKEAYVKELGVGITVDLQKILFSVDNTKELQQDQPLCGTTLMHNGLPMNQCYFEEHMLHPKYCAAIAFRNFRPDCLERFTFLEIKDLLKISGAQKDNDIIEYCQKVLSKSWK